MHFGANSFSPFVKLHQMLTCEILEYLTNSSHDAIVLNKDLCRLYDRITNSQMRRSHDETIPLCTLLSYRNHILLS